MGNDATTVLREWAIAIRLDWGSIDGRSCRDELNALAGFIDAQLAGEPVPDITAMRYAAGVCPFGGAHWQDGWSRCTAESCTPTESEDGR